MVLWLAHRLNLLRQKPAQPIHPSTASWQHCVGCREEAQTPGQMPYVIQVNEPFHLRCGRM